MVQWLLASTASGAISHVVGGPLGWAGASASFAAMQWLVLWRERARVGWQVVMETVGSAVGRVVNGAIAAAKFGMAGALMGAMVGMAVGAIIGLIVGTVSGAFQVEESIQQGVRGVVGTLLGETGTGVVDGVALGSLLGAVIGTLSGVALWLRRRRHADRSASWGLPSIMGLTVGLAAGWATGQVVDGIWPTTWFGDFGFIIPAAILWTVAGLACVLLLRQRVQQRYRESGQRPAR